MSTSSEFPTKAHRKPGQRSRRTLVLRLLGPLVALALILAGCGGSGGGDGSKSSGPVTIKVGYLKVIQWTHLDDIQAFLDPAKVKVEMKEFKTSNEVLVALSSGSIDVGDIGYNHMAGALERNQDDLEFIAGLSSKGSGLIQQKGGSIKDWADLKGKRIGGSRGSTQYSQLASGMKKHGLDVNKDIQFTNLTSATDMNVALKGKQVDAVMNWEPSVSEAIVNGYGQAIPAIAKTLYSDSFAVSSGVAARKKFVEDNKDAVQSFIDSYYKSYQKITTDKSYWVNTFAKLVSTPKAALTMATANAQPDFGMDTDDITKMMKSLADGGVTKTDMSDKIKGVLNYDFIAKASGKSATDLGKS